MFFTFGRSSSRLSVRGCCCRSWCAGLARVEEERSSHKPFYQDAFDGGVSVYQIVARVFATNVALAALG